MVSTASTTTAATCKTPPTARHDKWQHCFPPPNAHANRQQPNMHIAAVVKEATVCQCPCCPHQPWRWAIQAPCTAYDACGVCGTTANRPFPCTTAPRTSPTPQSISADAIPADSAQLGLRCSAGHVPFVIQAISYANIHSDLPLALGLCIRWVIEKHDCVKTRQLVIIMVKY